MPIPRRVSLKITRVGGDGASLDRLFAYGQRPVLPRAWQEGTGLGAMGPATLTLTLTLNAIIALQGQFPPRS